MICHLVCSNAKFDPYGNVIYFHIASASPLSWGGGVTGPTNVRIVQGQALKTKMDKLEFLVPWLDLRVGISVNPFLSILAA
ncbi:unnamed protein product [Eruca vesicaria subsp. sativa]|uniref:Uncharacterized protein n=1 Tax=Eruca vesicaria subsp. sativa TaxID=29727 RepID=A0ABC8KMN5_ERUVS|nr:unnamed protein product [Eruca vesicaria subsp. sativa]